MIFQKKNFEMPSGCHAIKVELELNDTASQKRWEPKIDPKGILGTFRVKIRQNSKKNWREANVQLLEGFRVAVRAPLGRWGGVRTHPCSQQGGTTETALGPTTPN